MEPAIHLASGEGAWLQSASITCGALRTAHSPNKLKASPQILRYFSNGARPVVGKWKMPFRN
jgi:hypothetical protein